MLRNLINFVLNVMCIVNYNINKIRLNVRNKTVLKEYRMIKLLKAVMNVIYYKTIKRVNMISLYKKHN